jgi:miniconductance mechanosensitive channel
MKTGAQYAAYFHLFNIFAEKTMIGNLPDSYFQYVIQAEDFLYRLYVPESWTPFFRDLFMLTILCFICIITFHTAKYIIKKMISRIVIKTKTEWDNLLFTNKFFNRLAYIVPAIFVLKLLPYTLPYYPGWISFLTSLANIYIWFVVLLVFFSMINSFGDIYDTWEISKQKPVKGYLQLIKVILALVVVIFIIAIIFNQSPVYLLTGLGALSALLLLIFKDALLGLVAGIQLSANDMARPGDWITMPKYNADGDVEEITLTTVTVRNFDRTLVFIPAYAMISDSFVNWRGMYEAEGRRIKRALNIDMNSVSFCSHELMEELKKIALITEYIQNKQTEIEAHNNTIHSDTSLPVNGRRQTNLGIFRAYMEAYIRSLDTINKETILMVRQLPPTDKGIPLELYAFCIYKEWIQYEMVQSDIFDHLIAALPHFNLQLYQSPAGGDIKGFISHVLHNPESD